MEQADLDIDKPHAPCMYEYMDECLHMYFIWEKSSDIIYKILRKGLAKWLEHLTASCRSRVQLLFRVK